MSSDGYYFWRVLARRGAGWTHVGDYPTRRQAQRAADETRELTRIERGGLKPPTKDCTVCGIWECADCGETRYYTYLVVDRCLYCDSKLGRMRPVKHHVGSRLAAKHAR